MPTLIPTPATPPLPAACASAPVLYTYFRSSAAYRVRIALGLKGLDWHSIPVHLVQDGGQHRSAAYRAINPQQLVPTFITQEGVVLTQSMAIMEYLEEAYPHSPTLLPTDALGRARVRALMQTVACEVHPLNNLRVLRYLEQELGATEAHKTAWYQHWVHEGLCALEAMLANNSATGRFCHGDTPTLADCCLVPQVFNAQRFACPMQDYPTICRIVQACEQLPAFVQAAPAQQADAAP